MTLDGSADSTTLISGFDSSAGYTQLLSPGRHFPRAVTQAEAVAEANTEAEAVADEQADEVTEDTEPTADKPKRRRKAREPVAVA
jgi:hypothetical protein